MNRSMWTTFTMLSALWSGTGAAQSTPHQHGHATLQLAVDNARVELLFSSPAGNLLGFEHQARTPEQKQAVEETKHWLATTPLINTAGGSCMVETSTPKMGSDSEHGHHDDDHQDDEHSDIRVSQALTCSDLADHSALTTPLLRQFRGIEELDVMWVTPDRQGAAALSSEQQEIRLAP